MKITVHCDRRSGPQHHFWCGTGFTPASLLLREDMAQALAYVASLPDGAVTHVRIHYLLNLVRATGLETESPEYDWSDLDRGIDALVSNGLKPFFEIMGNPSDFFSDFCNDGQLHAWRRMVRDVARHLMDRYGQEEVEGWYFETWNEPDAGWWHQWPQQEPFCNYYDACVEGLREANPTLRFGGPGTCMHMSDLFKAILEHCDSGTNYFTGETGVRLDFISVHEKGAWPDAEDVTPDSPGISVREAAIVDYIREHHPRFSDTPFMNNECDPIVGWGHIHTWHARPYYAGLICRVIRQHEQVLIDEKKCDYPLLSNDNGFLGRWGMRTQLTRLGTDKQIERGEFELIKKPALNVMAMLAMLGDQRVEVEGVEHPMEGRVGVMATRVGESHVAVLVYNSCDRIMSSGSETVELSLSGLPFDRCALTHYRIDEEHGDPFVLWDKNKAGLNPSDDMLQELRDSHELGRIGVPEERDVPDGAISLSFDLPLHGISLVLLSQKPAAGPDRVARLSGRRYRGTGKRENIFLRWAGQAPRDLRTYEVLFSETVSGPFERINASDLICSAFLHARSTSGGKGHYRVRAVDAWGRTGPESELLST